MKKTLLLCVIALGLTLAGCEKKMQHYTIDWEIETEEASFKVDSVSLAKGFVQITKAEVKDNHVRLEGDIQEPAIASVNVFFTWQGKSQATSAKVILEGGNIEIEGTPMGNVAGGTPLNDSIAKALEDVEELYEEGKDYSGVIPAYIQRHKDDISGAMMLSLDVTSSILGFEELMKAYESLDSKLQETPELMPLKLDLERAEPTMEGKMFRDFEATYEGKTTHLSDYVGKGQYVLVDFWASWCGPCRREIPNLKKIYEQYKSDKFTVLGVATWDEPANTLKAIEEDGVTYPQILNAQKAGSDAYAIDGIPEIILFGPDGTILKRGLRGEEIEKTLKEFLVND